MTERPNIRRMQVPEGVGEARAFDANRELDKTFWDKTADKINDNQGLTSTALQICAALVTIGRFKEEYISDSEWRRINEFVASVTPAKDQARMLAWMKQIRPDKTPDFSDDKWQEVVPQMKQAIRQHPSGAMWFATLGRQLHELRPQDHVLSTAEINAACSQLPKYRDERRWVDYAAIANAISTIDPTVDLEVTKEDWEGMRSQLDTYCRQEKWIASVTMAADMQNIAKWQASKKKRILGDSAMPESIAI